MNLPLCCECKVNVVEYIDAALCPWCRTDQAVCPNCDQWLGSSSGDCFNECKKRGFTKEEA
jgi:hypothetical protein